VLLHYLAKRGNMKIAFLHSNAVSVHCQNSTSRSLIYLFDSRLILKLLYDSLNLVINAFSSALLVHGLTERKSRELQQLDCVPHIMHVYQRAVLLQEKNLICNVFDSV